MEAATWPGDSFQVGDLDTKGGVVKVGAMICFDREQPESARILMLKGAEIILTPENTRQEPIIRYKPRERQFQYHPMEGSDSSRQWIRNASRQ